MAADLTERLANTAMGRPLLGERGEVLLGLASQWYQDTKIENLAGQMIQRIEDERNNAERRSFEAEVAAARLATLYPVDARSEVIATLIDAWRKTKEPEIRADIAKVVAWATLAPHDSRPPGVFHGRGQREVN